jgi:pyrroloquinoline quinone biosynthesis protein E
MGIVERPYALLAELTHRCPLACPYCSNPVHSAQSRELDTGQWTRVIREAATLGVLQIGFSGGEPLLRKDLETLVQVAREAGLYTNLITSGLGLTESRADQLAKSGLDNIQLSFQAAERELADQIAGARNAHDRKVRTAKIVQERGIALSLNIVLHAFNIDAIAEFIDFAEKLGATRLELANTQYYGWAFLNRSKLIPKREQVEAASQKVQAARKRLEGVMKILYVLPDYFTGRPKPCMNGWGRKYITVSPSGLVLPCPTAWEIPGLAFDSILESSLDTIWECSESFSRFRGTEWMPEPCRSCPNKEIDFGGCRCQAALLTGDPSRTDPACELSPDHHLIREAVGSGNEIDMDGIIFRRNPSVSPESMSN